MLRRVFEDWEKEVLRPIVVSVTTALVLFLFALVSKPVRDFFFPDEAKDYPVLCTVEPYKSADGKHLLVDFVFFNRTDEPRSREQLLAALKARGGEGNSTRSPDINLQYQGKEGFISEAAADAAFNKAKGELLVSFERDSLNIQIQHIEAWSLLRATATIANISRMPTITLTRLDRAEIPFEYETLLRGCYTR